MHRTTILLSYSLIGLLLNSCQEKALMDKNPDDSKITLTNLTQAQALLDATSIINQAPSLGEISADDYYLAAGTTSDLGTVEINASTWQADLFENKGNSKDWNTPYTQVYYANSILDAWGRIAQTGANEQADNVYGSALFTRAYAFFNIAALFAPVYDNNNAASTAGIPLRLEADIETRSTRATLQETIEQIITDCTNASPLLPAQPDPARKTRASQPAVYALMARLHLYIGNYDKAYLYADSCLQRMPALTNYRDSSLWALTGKRPNYAEIIYESSLLNTAEIMKRFVVDSNLVRLYEKDDLRTSLYFTGSLPTPNRSWFSPLSWFCGLSVDEMYLVRAEAAARTGYTREAMNDLNALRASRWRNGNYIPLATTDKEEAIHLILLERRKELVYRGIRWLDLKRFNKLEINTTLLRTVDSKPPYTLPPGDKRYVLPIPPDVIKETGMEQNPR